MSSRLKQWRDNDKFDSLNTYVAACNKFLGEVEQIEAAVENYGSDPLGILDLLSSPTPEVASTFDEAMHTGKEFPPPLDIKAHIEEVGEVVGADPGIEVGGTTHEPLRNDVHDEGPVDPDAGLTTRQKNEKRRLAEKNQKNVSFLYAQLMNGPMSATEIRAKGQARNITEYALDQARRSVDDILLRTVGFQGATWWYLQGDEHKLPSGEGTKKAKQEGVQVVLTPQENVILNYLPATLAELIGKTHWNVDKVNMNISKLQEKNRIKLNKQSSVWSKV